MARSIDFSAARQRLADSERKMRDAMAGDGAWAAALLARRSAELAATETAGRLHDPVAMLLLRAGGEQRLAMPLDRLSVIVPMGGVACLPRATPALLGLAAVRGRVVRLFDLAALAGGDKAQGDGGYVLLLRHSPAAALRVTAVDETTVFDRSTWRPPPEGARLVAALTPGGVAVLDAERIERMVTERSE